MAPFDITTPPTKNALRNSSISLGGTSLGAALVATGAAKDLIDAEESTGAKLTIFEAFRTAFCVAFGGNIPFIGMYVKVVGFNLFLVVLLVLTVAGAMGENALHKAVIKTGATSFSDMSEAVPGFMAPISSISLVVWCCVLQALYVQFMFTFLNDQILNGMFPVNGGIGSAPLYISLGVVVFLITIQPQFSGPCVKTTTTINLYTTYVVLALAGIKGLHLIFTEAPEARPTEYQYWDVDGIGQASALLAASMFQCLAVPRLQYELKPELRERGAWMIPTLLGSIQSAIFVVVGSIGYWALGDRIEAGGDVFRTYYTLAPDWMVSVLQGGIALLMFLSTPLLGIPAKSEVWSLIISPRSHGANRVPFEKSPLLVRIGINLLMVSITTLMPMLAGRQAMLSILTVSAGIAANWLNLFMPCAVIVFSMIIPAWRNGDPWIGNTLKVFLIMAIAINVMIGAVAKIINLF